jgi:tRNA(fMet)-specific endonuclease VapC
MSSARSSRRYRCSSTLKSARGPNQFLARFEYLLKASSGNDVLRAQSWLIASESLLADLHVLRFTNDSAEQFDRLRRQKKLRKIGRADLLIAGIALAHHATLVTRNLRHFRQIDGLIVENWAD